MKNEGLSISGGDAAQPLEIEDLLRKVSTFLSAEDVFSLMHVSRDQYAGLKGLRLSIILDLLEYKEDVLRGEMLDAKLSPGFACTAFVLPCLFAMSLFSLILIVAPSCGALVPYELFELFYDRTTEALDVFLPNQFALLSDGLGYYFNDWLENAYEYFESDLPSSELQSDTLDACLGDCFIVYLWQVTIYMLTQEFFDYASAINTERLNNLHKARKNNLSQRKKRLLEEVKEVVAEAESSLLQGNFSAVNQDIFALHKARRRAPSGALAGYSV